MLDTIAGLPVHVLVIHAVVVLAPLAGLAAVLYAVRPAWRAVLRWPLLGLAAVSAAGATVAAASGEELEARLRGLGIGGATLEAIETHAERGELVRNTALVFVVLVALATLWLLAPAEPPDARARGGAAVAVVVAALVAVAGVGLVITTFLAGHSGSTAVWSEIGKASGGS
ncbi:DUF2231 domain-containing protein [Oryzobacter terrae]|uniref:DUF2231 domain-containing protein n=1 Tax=Oryzobacter terrae TaxID=1620385 RepID=UPI00366C74F7